MLRPLLAAILAVWVAGAPAVAAAGDGDEAGEAAEAAEGAEATKPTSSGDVELGEPHYGRAAIEIGVGLLGGIMRYALDPSKRTNWDFPSIQQRLSLEAWRYDTNTFKINHNWHALSGSFFHLIARSNNLGLLATLGYGFAGSMFWEFAVEFRENVSINDVILTPVAGVSIGEFLHWLGRYLAMAPDDTGNRLARWTFGSLQAAHDRLDGIERPRRPSIWHRLIFTTGFSHADPTRRERPAGQDSLDLHHFEFDGRLVALPGYLAPGRWRRGFAQGNVTSLRLRTALGAGDHGFEVFADTVIAGWHMQDVPESGTGRALTIGTSAAYHYRLEQLGGWEDRLGIVHFPGLAIDADLLGDWGRLHASARFHGDFVGVHALPFALWNEANPDLVETTVLRKHGYYFGWGVSTRLGAELTTRWLDAGGALYYGHYGSDEGLDRNQEELDIDLHASDDVTDLATWLRIKPLSRPLFLELRLEKQIRSGRVETYTDRATFTRATVAIGGEL